MPTNTRESGLEDLIVNHLITENGYEQGDVADFDKSHAIDEKRLLRFLKTTQPDTIKKFSLEDEGAVSKFLDRLQGEIAKQGVVNIIRKGLRGYPGDLDLFYPTPSDRNEDAKEIFKKNIFSVTRQLHYSNDVSRKSLDIVIFINGLPIFTMELKNRWTKQDVQDAIKQYKVDRNPRDLIFNFKRCVAHFAIDDEEIYFCTKLEGTDSYFLPFNKGYNDGAGNPPNPTGTATDYFWKEILKKEELANILENYTQLVKETDHVTKKVTEKQIFPRYHQLSVVKALLADVKEHGIGSRYLIQHSAGSGKSNSIAWLAYQLVELEKDGKNLTDSVLVVTDRRNLDKQIRDTIKSFTSVSNNIAWAEHSKDLKEAIQDGKRIIITTIHKFPYIFADMGSAHKDHRFAIIIDEAHSSQSGNMSAKMNMALSTNIFNDDDESEDIVNKIIENRKLLPNASYFAFTATPKNKTLELFGTPYKEDGKTKHRPFHNYSMKQTIDESFILDVLKNYTPYQSYYHLIKTIENDPLFDKTKAQKKLRSYVEQHPEAIAKKAKIIVEHFHEGVAFLIKGQARAMVVTGSIKKAIEYFDAINTCLKERKSPYKAIVAYTGGAEHADQKSATEADLNGFPSSQIEAIFRTGQYRFLICADKFQTGYDEPLLHTMYVDKILFDIKAVQTLSRLNRARKDKVNTFVLDFANKSDDIKESFSRYYKTTLLSDETDPNNLNGLIAKMENQEVYTKEDIEAITALYLKSKPRNTLEPILDVCVGKYKNLEEDAQVEFKSCAKSFVRLYNFLAAVLTYGMADWEKLSIFLTLLLPKLPSPKEEDDTKELLKYVELESYRAQAQAKINISLEDFNYELDPVETDGSGFVSQPEPDYLTHILYDFHSRWSNIDWVDEDNVQEQIKRIPDMLTKNEAYQNAIKNANKSDARMESYNAMNNVMLTIMQSSLELYKQYQDNPSFKEFLNEFGFISTYPKGKPVSTGTQKKC
ncbi:DEAD/DEAH box helicase family protein [Treponema primitia]|uniref:type I restriction endonuclease subunit R n=1 Tax=Treponema primitia TaxID=88058 RepID=UPI00397E9D04